MPAKSKSQQRFMGMVYAAKKGKLDNPSPEVEKAAKSMKKSDAKDYASTKHDKLPEKVREAMNYTEYLEHLEQATSPDYAVEGKLPQCPPGFIYDRERKDCVPKTKKDGVKGKLEDKKDERSGASYRVWGSHGQNGAPPAYEEPFVRNGGGAFSDSEMS